jgi:predicted ATP-grasp superfamily ATP-dependent carboligase
VDLLDTANGPMVLEINPRLTTSCSGLRAATGVNVAARVLGLDPRVAGAPSARPRGRSVTLSLEAAHGE